MPFATLVYLQVATCLVILQFYCTILTDCCKTLPFYLSFSLFRIELHLKANDDAPNLRRIYTNAHRIWAANKMQTHESKYFRGKFFASIRSIFFFFCIRTIDEHDFFISILIIFTAGKKKKKSDVGAGGNQHYILEKKRTFSFLNKIEYNMNLSFSYIQPVNKNIVCK